MAKGLFKEKLALSRREFLEIRRDIGEKLAEIKIAKKRLDELRIQLSKKRDTYMLYLLEVQYLSEDLREDIEMSEEEMFVSNLPVSSISISEHRLMVKEKLAEVEMAEKKLDDIYADMWDIIEKNIKVVD